MQSGSRKASAGDIPDDLASILKLLRQAREQAESGDYKMLTYILRMAEAEAVDLASSSEE